jgi:predicted nucleic acid-binding protein
VKLIVAEPESDALAETVQVDWPYLLASEIIAIECHRAALRAGGAAPKLAADRVAAVGLLGITPDVLRNAQKLGPPHLRALDAVHLATAVSVADQIGAVLTYDVRLAGAARTAGLTVLAPG